MGSGDEATGAATVPQSAASVPLLLTRGSKDVSSEAASQRLLQLAGPASKLVTFEGSASLAHVEQRSKFNEAVLDAMDAADGVRSRRAVDDLAKPVLSAYQ